MASRGCATFKRMTTRRRRSFPSPALVAGALAVLAAAPSVVRADVTKAECIQANATAQDARRDLKFSAAREQLARCIDPSCPAMVRDDCARRLDELQKAQPTIVFDAKDASGRDVVAVKVTIDGKPLAEKLVGAALSVDPGEHTFTFAVPGSAPVTQTFVIKEGEKERREGIVLGGPVPTPLAPGPGPSPVPAPPPTPLGPPPTPASSSSEPPPEPPTVGSQGGGMGTQKVLGLVAAGVGVAGVAVGSVFGIMTISQKNQEVADCAAGTTCSPSNYSLGSSARSAAFSDGTISTVGFIAGGVLVAGGLALFFTAHSTQQPGGTGLLVVPSVGPESAGVLLRGDF
jgi:hypothetical protein